YASLAVFMVIIAFIYIFREFNIDPKKINVCFVLLFILGQMVLTSLIWSMEDRNPYYGIGKYADSGTVYDTVYNKNSYDVLNNADSTGYFRVGENGVSSAMNVGALKDVTLFKRYYSMAESSILEFCRKLGLNTTMDFKIEGTGKREILDILFNTAYYISNTDNEDTLPFNYRNKSGEEDVSLYSPDTFIPFGYTYSSFITEEEFEKLSLTDRQEVMMESAVVDGECPLEKKMPVLHNENVLKSVTKADESKLDITDNSFYLKEGYNSIIKLELINGKRNSDYYIELTGLDFKEEGKQKWYSEEAVSKMSAVERRRFKAETTFTMPDNEAKLYFGYDMEDFPYEAEYLNAGHISYTGHDSILVNLGHHEEPVNEIYIKIKEPGLYSFDELKVVCSDVSNINAQAEKLAEESFYDTQFFTNGFRGKITASSERLLVMSVPYSPGWKAYVDGQAADIYRTNVMMMGVMVGEGEHEVVMKYETPLLRIGVMLTVSGVVILIILLAVGYQIRKKNGFSKEN
nr:YfhO family protein [Lachnospiraceae bacterium]